MKKKTSIFQMILIGVFLAMMAIGFLLFTNYKGAEEKNKIQVGRVVVWGTMSRSIVGEMINNIIYNDNVYKDVVYVEKSKEDYNQEILEALASDNSPDLILVSNENLYKNLNKITVIPYTNYPKRDFINTYADAFSIFTNNEGVLAIPFSIDPMVMYYNKSVFKTAGIPLPPIHWKDFYELSKKLTVLDNKENIIRSAVSFGESINVSNIKDILTTLMMQLGNNIVVNLKDGGYGVVDWNKDFAYPTDGIKFFMDFSNPNNSVYSWNRSLPESNKYFLSGRLATYFGFASEAPIMRYKNPNLNFDVAEIPSVERENNKTVFAKVWAFAIPKASEVNTDGAFSVATALSSEDSQKFLSEKLKLPPVRKSMLSQRPEDIFMDIFYREAIYANSYIDPNWEETDKIFKYMINFIKGGRGSPSAAIKTAFDEINNLF